MIDVIWIILILFSAAFSFFFGSTDSFIKGISEGAGDAVSVVIAMCGIMGFWGGITELSERAGILDKLKKLLNPVICKLFPEYSRNPKISGLIASNIAANICGLGNAATPLGIEAVESMGKRGDSPDREMIMFVLINTASLQLIPSNMAALRSSYGSERPYIILIPVLLSSLASLIVTVPLCKRLTGGKRWKK